MWELKLRLFDHNSQHYIVMIRWVIRFNNRYLLWCCDAWRITCLITQRCEGPQTPLAERQTNNPQELLSIGELLSIFHQTTGCIWSTSKGLFKANLAFLSRILNYAVRGGYHLLKTWLRVRKSRKKLWNMSLSFGQRGDGLKGNCLPLYALGTLTHDV